MQQNQNFCSLFLRFRFQEKVISFRTVQFTEQGKILVTSYALEENS